MRRNTCSGTTRLLTIALWAMRVQLVYMAEYNKPHFLSSGGVGFCRLANNGSLTHSVEVLACWVSTGLLSFFFRAPGRKKRTSLLGGWWCNLIWVEAMWSQNSLSSEEVKLLLHHWVQVICHSHLVVWSVPGKGCSGQTVVSPSVIMWASAEKSSSRHT